MQNMPLSTFQFFVLFEWPSPQGLEHTQAVSCLIHFEVHPSTNPVIGGGSGPPHSAQD